MRPRHKAAEIGELTTKANEAKKASMRPRHKAAEIREDAAPRPPVPHASMRPRHKAAEIALCATRSLSPPPRFNEAAA